MMEILQVLICLAETLFPFWLGNKILERRYQKTIGKVFWYAGMVVYIGSLIYQRHFYMYSRFFMLWAIIFTCILFWRYYKVSFWKSVLLLSIYYETIAIMDLLGMTLPGLVNGKEDEFLVNVHRNITYERILIYTAVRLLLFLIFSLLIYKNNDIYWGIESKIIIVLFPVFEYISMVQCEGAFYGKYGEAIQNIYLYFLAYVVSLSYLIIAFVRSNSDYLRKISEQKNQFIEKDYKRIIEQNRQREMLIHDTNKHYIVLEGFLEEQENEKALEYVKELKKDICKNARKITTGNMVLDAILNDKLELSKMAGIDFAADIESMNHSFVQDKDWCVLIANLLDNAFEAVEQEKEKVIGVHLKRKESGIIIHIENSFTGSLKMNGKQILTTKSRNELHGWGLQSVKQVVKKYAGIMNYEHKDNMFHVYIMLYK